MWELGADGARSSPQWQASSEEPGNGLDCNQAGRPCGGVVLQAQGELGITPENFSEPPCLGHGPVVRNRETAEFVPDPVMVDMVFRMKGGLRWKVRAYLIHLPVVLGRHH